MIMFYVNLQGCNYMDPKGLKQMDDETFSDFCLVRKVMQEKNKNLPVDNGDWNDDDSYRS